MSEEEEDVDEGVVVEQNLLSIGECFIYKVPPLRTASGHRAEEWGLASPLLTGFLRVTQADTKLKITLYSYRDPSKLLASDENLVKFAECPIEVAPHGDITAFVDAVIDSSRYYVLRIKDPASTRTTLLGIGFRDREVAFDFKSVLNEYVRYVDRMDAAKKLSEERRVVGAAGGDGNGGGGGGEGSESAATGHALEPALLQDLTIKEGAKIHIPLPGAGAGSGKRRDIKPLKSFGSYGTIAPPPPPGSVVFSTLPSLEASTDAGDDEEWGTFDSAVAAAPEV